MKNLGIVLLSVLVISCAVSKNKNQENRSMENKKITSVINAFSKAGDENNAKELSKYLDDNYRVVMNRLFGSKSVLLSQRYNRLRKIYDLEKPQRVR